MNREPEFSDDEDLIPRRSQVEEWNPERLEVEVEPDCSSGSEYEEYEDYESELEYDGDHDRDYYCKERSYLFAAIVHRKYHKIPRRIAALKEVHPDAKFELSIPLMVPDSVIEQLKDAGLGVRFLSLVNFAVRNFDDLILAVKNSTYPIEVALANGPGLITEYCLLSRTPVKVIPEHHDMLYPADIIYSVRSFDWYDLQLLDRTDLEELLVLNDEYPTSYAPIMDDYRSEMIRCILGDSDKPELTDDEILESCMNSTTTMMTFGELDDDSVEWVGDIDTCLLSHPDQFYIKHLLQRQSPSQQSIEELIKRASQDNDKYNNKTTDSIFSLIIIARRRPELLFQYRDNPIIDHLLSFVPSMVKSARRDDYGSKGTESARTELKSI